MPVILKWRMENFGGFPCEGKCPLADKRVRRPLQGDFFHTYYKIGYGQSPSLILNSQFSIKNGLSTDSPFYLS